MLTLKCKIDFEMQLNRSNLKNFLPAAPIGITGDIFIHSLLSLIARIYILSKK